MTSTNSMFVSIIIVSFIVLQNINADSSGNFTLDQYAGLWYALGIISPTVDPNADIRCYRINVTKIYDQKFLQDINLIINEERITVGGHGNIVNGEIRVYYPTVNDTSVFLNAAFNFGKELILHDQLHPLSYGLLSRETSALSETRAEFERLGYAHELTPSYISYKNCT